MVFAHKVPRKLFKVKSAVNTAQLRLNIKTKIDFGLQTNFIVVRILPLQTEKTKNPLGIPLQTVKTKPGGSKIRTTH